MVLILKCAFCLNFVFEFSAVYYLLSVTVVIILFIDNE